MSHSLSAVSFRDPAGFVYCDQGDLRRQVNQAYREHYDELMASGLYQELVEERLLIKHEEIEAEGLEPSLAYKVIRPEKIEFVSYPYEWSFSQFQDAALVALEVQRRALLRGMTLKDCSVYNIQFHQGRPIFIDTLSFEIYREGEPWIGYRQFCEHFLAPLALQSLTDYRLAQLCRTNIDGVPLDLAAPALALAVEAAIRPGGAHSHPFRPATISGGRGGPVQGPQPQPPCSPGPGRQPPIDHSRLTLEAARQGLGDLLRRQLIHPGRVSAQGPIGCRVSQAHPFAAAFGTSVRTPVTSAILPRNSACPRSRSTLIRPVSSEPTLRSSSVRPRSSFRSYWTSSTPARPRAGSIRSDRRSSNGEALTWYSPWRSSIISPLPAISHWKTWRLSSIVSRRGSSSSSYRRPILSRRFCGPAARDSSSLRSHSLRRVLWQALYTHHLRAGFPKRTSALPDAPARRGRLTIRGRPGRPNTGRLLVTIVT